MQLPLAVVVVVALLHCATGAPGDLDRLIGDDANELDGEFVNPGALVGGDEDDADNTGDAMVLTPAASSCSCSCWLESSGQSLWSESELRISLRSMIILTR